jgi:serine/threonine protein kinase/tetratricopeptide (TPR) repeat protein
VADPHGGESPTSSLPPESPGPRRAAPSPSAFSLEPGARVGHYVIRQALGEGGFGAVYQAEQTEPVRRMVALKLIKPGMDSKAVVNRFEAERQALAVMDHPCIAKVLDGGVTDQGRPFFAMELVRGLPITEHCDTHRLSLPERIGVFIRVCEAVQHAHTKGVIHRDLKPSNVLVSYGDGVSVPKVIDFGVAKALSARLTEATIFTQQGQLIGTPEYMSPEQAEMGSQDIDTRSDIYSLGVILYELLSGATPFDPETLRRAGYAEIQRIIREVEPPRPSTRLASGLDGDRISEAASRRRIEPRSLGSALRRDLDWIVMRCLEKDRSRRYDTANALAMELERYLSDEPVLAGPPSVRYKLGKFVRRNRVGVIASAAGMVLLVGGLAGTSVGLIEARRQRALATARAEDLQVVADFQAEQLGAIQVRAMGDRIRGSIIAAAPPASRASLDEALAPVNFTDIALGALEASVFEQTIEAIDAQFGSRPIVRARLHQTLAITLRRLGLRELAAVPQQRALSIRRAELGDEHPDTLASLANTGLLLKQKGEFAEAEAYYREAVRGMRRTLGDDDPYTITWISNLGRLLQDRGEIAEAEVFFREALERRRRVLGDDDPDTLVSMSIMGSLLRSLDRLEESEVHCREAYEGFRRTLGDDHRLTLTAMSQLGSILYSLERLDEAETRFRGALEGYRRALGDDHPNTLTSMGNLAVLLVELDRAEEAMPLLDEAVERGRAQLGDRHWATGTLLDKRGRALLALARYLEAEAAMLEAHAILVAVFGEGHALPAGVAGYLADLYDAWHAAEPDAGRGADAEAWRARSEADQG